MITNLPITAIKLPFVIFVWCCSNIFPLKTHSNQLLAIRSYSPLSLFNLVSFTQIENLPIFDKLVFLSGDEYITQNQADKRYLRYPNAQGTENLQAINVGGTSNFNEEANFNDVLKSKLQLQVIDSTASGAITESVVLANVATGNRIVYILNPNNNAYNKLTQPNDNLMVYGDVIDSVGALTIAPWSSTCNGLRMTQDTVMLGSGETADNPTHRINTDTTQLLLTSSNLNVDGNITSVNATAANRDYC